MLCYLSARECVAAFCDRSLSPVDLMHAVIARSEEMQPHINAFARWFPERALAAARVAEARYRAGDARPLEGLPLAVKDLHPIAGEITTHGSLVFRDNRDDATLVVVQRLLDAGALLFARSTSPEFGLATVTHSTLYGVTRNPWAPMYTPGGSSGGAGAALASGMVTIADGSDYGGSIRIPASCCGVVGYKPPRGRNPGDSFDPCSHFGPMARTVDDVLAMQNVMSGPAPSDPCALPERIVLDRDELDVRGMRIAVSIDLGHKHVDPEVERATRETVEVLAQLGCIVEEVDLPWDDRIREAYEAHHAASDASASWMLLPTQRELLTDYAVHEIERGLRVSGRAVFDANEVRGDMYRSLAGVFERARVLICSTTTVPAVAAEHSPIADARGWVMTYPFNLLSTLPVLAVQSGIARTGVPMGIQIVGRPFDDASVFCVGLALERARGPWFADEARRPRRLVDPTSQVVGDSRNPS